MIDTKVIDALDHMQSQANDGRGIQCVKAIVTYLRRGDFASALNIRVVDGDKTRSHHDVEVMLYNIFGCRMHQKKDCGHEWCDRKPTA